MSYQQGSLRQVQRKDGLTWFLRYRTEKNGKRVENTKRIGLVSGSANGIRCVEEG
jgi:hypothetical protein